MKHDHIILNNNEYVKGFFCLFEIFCGSILDSGRNKPGFSKNCNLLAYSILMNNMKSVPLKW